MLKKEFRLNRKELDHFFKKRSRFLRGKYVIMRFCSAETKEKKFAFIASVSKKRGGAVLRNKLRRQMSEIVRGKIGDIKSGMKIVFFMKIEKSPPPSFKDLKNDILNLLNVIY